MLCFCDVCLGSPTTENVCQCVFPIKLALMINLRLIWSCYAESWSSMILGVHILGLSWVPHHEKNLSLVTSNSLYNTYYILTSFSLLLTRAKLAQNFHALFLPPGPYPPTGNRQTSVSMFALVYRSLLGTTNFVTFPARLTPLGSRSISTLLSRVFCPYFKT